ncbi:Uncharacterised protein [Burkholderia pseudomallei]|nr:Uncharacterised protein [Burkholderia pseudomallei]
MQQRVRDVERNRRRHLTAERVGRDDGRLAGAVDERHVVHRERAGIHLPRRRLAAVDEQIDRGGHRGLARELRQRIGDDVGPHLEIALDGHAPQAHGARPRQRARDHVARGVRAQPVLVRITPERVVAQIAVAPDAAGAATVIAPVDARVRHGAPSVEQPLLGPCGRVARAERRRIRIHVVIEQEPEADGRGRAVVQPRRTERLARQPVGRHGELQALLGALVFDLHAVEPRQIDERIGLRARAHRRLREIARARIVDAVAIANRHDAPRRQRVHDELEIQRAVRRRAPHGRQRAAEAVRERRRLARARVPRRRECDAHRPRRRAPPRQSARSVIVVPLQGISPSRHCRLCRDADYRFEAAPSTSIARSATPLTVAISLELEWSLRVSGSAQRIRAPGST